MARRIPSLLTAYDIRRICLDSTEKKQEDCHISRKKYDRFDLSFLGNAFELVFENGDKTQYRFGREFLEWRNDGESFHEEKAQCAVMKGRFVLIHHMFTEEIPYTAETIVIDLEQKSAVVIDMKFGNIHSNRDVVRTVRYAGLNQPCDCKDLLTDELTGVVIDWKYDDGCIIHHMYENRSCNEFVSFIPEKMPEWEDFFYTFNPTRYLKLDENIVLISFYAPGMSGVAVNQLMDLDEMKCIGSFWGIDFDDELRSYMFDGIGAYAEARFVGRYAVD